MSEVLLIAFNVFLLWLLCQRIAYLMGPGPDWEEYHCQDCPHGGLKPVGVAVKCPACWKRDTRGESK